MSKHGAASSSSSQAPPLTQNQTSVPSLSQGHPTTEFEKILHEYLNQTGAPINYSQCQHPSLESLLFLNSNFARSQECSPVFTITLNRTATPTQGTHQFMEDMEEQHGPQYHSGKGKFLSHHSQMKLTPSLPKWLVRLSYLREDSSH